MKTQETSILRTNWTFDLLEMDLNGGSRTSRPVHAVQVSQQCFPFGMQSSAAVVLEINNGTTSLSSEL